MAAVTGINFLPMTDMAPRKTFHHWSEDFDLYIATSWVITETGSGTRAIAQAKDGIFVITDAAGGTDSNALQLRDVASGQVAEHWKFASGKRLYFGACFKVSDVLLSDWVMGLQITDTTPKAVSDGIWFQHASSATVSAADFHVAASSAQSDLTAAIPMVNDTYTVLEFYYDGVTSAITAYKDGVAVGSLPLTNAPSHTLVLSIYIGNGEAVAKSMSIDWIEIIQERG